MSNISRKHSAAQRTHTYGCACLALLSNGRLVTRLSYHNRTHTGHIHRSSSSQSTMQSSVSIGSFENQHTSISGSHKATQKRGIAATLADATNILEVQPSRKASKEHAVSAIRYTSKYSTMQALRGLPEKAGMASAKKCRHLSQRKMMLPPVRALTPSCKS